MAITDINSGALIYLPESGAALGGTWSSVSATGGTLTLVKSTSGFSGGDVLRVIYAAEYGQATRANGLPTTLPLDQMNEISQKWSQDRVEVEGWRTAQGIRYNGLWSNAGGLTSVGNVSLTVQGEAFLCNHILISSSRFCEVQVVADFWPIDNTGFNEPTFDFRVPVNGQVLIPLQTVLLTNPVMYLKTENGDNANVILKMHTSGWRITDDLNLTARKSILWVGDSILRGSGLTGGVAAGKDMYSFITKEYLNLQGFDYRLINRAVGGASSVNSELWRVQDRLTTQSPRNVGIVFYNMGANDSADPATYTTNLTTFVQWALMKFPTALIIVLGPTPAENNTTEAGLVTIRGNASSYVSGLANSRVKYLNLGTAFDRTLGVTVYSTADSAGVRIHPNVASNAAIGAMITSYLSTITSSIP
jgi:hypothetical protein